MTQRNIPDAVRMMLIRTAAQRNELGASEQQIRTLVRSGGLTRIRHGVYATKSSVEWAGSDPVHLLTPPKKQIVTLTLPPDKSWNRPAATGMRFYSAELPPSQVTRLYKLPITSVARTVVDLARTLPFKDAVVVADSALSREHDEVTKPQLNEER